jgi:hypothetical protein
VLSCSEAERGKRREKIEVRREKREERESEVWGSVAACKDSSLG